MEPLLGRAIDAGVAKDIDFISVSEDGADVVGGDRTRDVGGDVLPLGGEGEGEEKKKGEFFHIMCDDCRHDMCVTKGEQGERL